MELANYILSFQKNRKKNWRKTQRGQGKHRGVRPQHVTRL